MRFPISLPLQLCLYLATFVFVFHIIAQHQLRRHMYADDSQVYVTTPANDTTTAVAHISAAITDIND